MMRHVAAAEARHMLATHGLQAGRQAWVVEPTATALPLPTRGAGCRKSCRPRISGCCAAHCCRLPTTPLQQVGPAATLPLDRPPSPLHGPCTTGLLQGAVAETPLTAESHPPPPAPLMPPTLGLAGGAMRPGICRLLCELFLQELVPDTVLHDCLEQLLWDVSWAAATGCHLYSAAAAGSCLLRAGLRGAGGACCGCALGDGPGSGVG